MARKTLWSLCAILLIGGGVLYWALHSSNTELPTNAKTEATSPSTATTEKTPAETETLRGAPTSESAKIETAESRQEATRQFPNYLKGRVLVQGKAPVPANTSVQARCYWESTKKEEKLSGAVEADGHFAIGVSTLPSYASFTAESDFLYGEPTGFEIKDDGSFPEAVLRLQPGGKIEGRVLLPDSTPAKNARVLLGFPQSQVWGGGRPTMPVKEITTDAEGRFSFRGVQTGRDRRVRSSLKNYGPVSASMIEVKALATTPLTLSLSPESTVSGKIVGENDSPIGGATLTFVPGKGIDSYNEFSVFNDFLKREVEIQSAEDGSFRIDSLGNGKFRVLLVKKGFAANPGETLTLAAGEKKDNLRLLMKEGGTISGKVLDRQGAPLAGVTVEAKTIGGYAPSAAPNPLNSDPTTSAEDGSFTIRGLGKGPYNLTANREGVGTGGKTNVNVGVSGLEIRLAPFGSISGRLSSSVPSAEISKFKITLTKLDRGFMPTTIKTEQFQDKEGKFTLEGISSGQLSLFVTATGFSSIKKQITLKEAETVKDLEIVIEPAATVKGIVIDPSTGEPVSGAEIMTKSAQGAYGAWQDRMDPAKPRGVSDAEGKFEFTGLSAGKFSLICTHPDFSLSTFGPIELKSGETIENIEFKLLSGGGIDGYFYTAEGMPISGGSVDVFGMQSGAYKNTTTDGNGYFIFPRGLATEKHQVRAMSSFGDGDSQAEQMADLAKSMKTATIEVEEGKITRLTLGGNKEGGCKLTGRVLSGTQSVAGAYVSLIPKSKSENKMGDMKFTVTDKDGRFTLENVPAGEQSFNIRRSTGSAADIQIEVPSRSEFSVDFKLPNGSVSGRITDAKTGKPIPDLVVSMAPDKESKSSSWSFSGYGQTKTDEDGRYRIGDIKEGNFVVSAGSGFFGVGSEGKGYGRSVRNAQVRSEENLEGVDFALNPGGIVEGKVTANGAPVAGASIFFKDAHGQVMNALSDSTTDADGHFEFKGLSEGSYTIVAKANGYALGKTELVSIRESSKTTVQIPLSKGTEVTVKVTGADSKDLDGVSIQAYDEQDNVVTGMLGMEDISKFWTEGKKAGTYPLGHLAAGKYKITASKDGYEALSTEVLVNLQAQQTIELKLTAK